MYEGAFRILRALGDGRSLSPDEIVHVSGEASSVVRDSLGRYSKWFHEEDGRVRCSERGLAALAREMVARDAPNIADTTWRNDYQAMADERGTPKRELDQIYAPRQPRAPLPGLDALLLDMASTSEHEDTAEMALDDQTRRVLDQIAFAVMGVVAKVLENKRRRRQVEDERWAYFIEAALVDLDLPDAIHRGYEGDDAILGPADPGDEPPVDMLRREILRLEPQQLRLPRRRCKPHRFRPGRSRFAWRPTRKPRPLLPPNRRRRRPTSRRACARSSEARIWA